MAGSTATEAMEEEEYGRCDGANPQRRLDDALLSLAADGILLRVGEHTNREVRKSHCREIRDQMHTTIEEEAVADKENTDDGENIFVQKMKGGVVDRN